MEEKGDINLGQTDIETRAETGNGGTKVRISLDEATGDFWIDNGLIALSEIVGEGEFEVDDVLNKLVKKLVNKTGTKKIYFDIDENKFKEYDVSNWMWPANKFIKSNPSPNKVLITKKEWNEDKETYKGIIKTSKESISINIPNELKERISKETNKQKSDIEIFLEPPKYNITLKIDNKKGICYICGTASPVSEGKQWMYPFLVTPNKFGNFYSFSRRGIYLCPRCALAGLAGYLAWMYAIRGKDYMHIFMFHSDMKTLLNIRKGIVRRMMSESENKSRNVPMEFYGEYIHETTLGLLFSVFSQLRSKEDGDSEIMELLAELDESLSNPINEIKLYAISGKPGQGFNMNAYREFSKISALYSLYKKWIGILEEKFPEESSINLLNRIFEQFYTYKNRKTNTIWRDKISWAIMEFGDPFIHIESYLYEGIGNEKEENRWGLRKGTLHVFNLYLKEVLKMEEKYAKILAGFGHELGGTCAEKDEMGILYSLRNAKNIDDFLKVLNDINFKLEMRVNEELLKIDGEKIMGQPWIRVKTLLSIYAMNSYLWEKKKKGGA